MADNAERDVALAAQDPNEEVSPVDCDATANQCEWQPNDDPGNEPGEGGLRDEVADQFPLEEIKLIISPEDGMPIPADEPLGLSEAPAFTRENVVCVEDDRQYVEMFVEDMVERGWYRLEQQGWGFRGHRVSEIDVRCRWDENGRERTRLVFIPGEITERFGHKFSPDGKIPVRPIRERCKYYQRQLIAETARTPRDFGKAVLRNCLARRSIGGAFLSMRDEAVFACDYRDPPDEATTKELLDKPDDERLNQHQG